MDAVIYDGSSITSKTNASNPKLNAPCHLLHTDSRNYVIMFNDQGGSSMKVFNESGKGYQMEGVGCLRAEGENRPSRPGHIVIGCDLYNGSLTWDVACNMNANSNASANHAGPSLLILNDQGGSIMDVSEDVTACLRAQDHWHPPVVCFVECNSHLYANDETAQTIRAKYRGIPVICFEPGIAKREGNDSRLVMNKCGTLRADMGDNQPAVCYGVSRSCLKGGNGSNGGMPIGENVQPAMTANGCGAVAYTIENHPGDSRISIKEDGIVQTLTSRIGTGGGQHANGAGGC